MSLLCLSSSILSARRTFSIATILLLSGMWSGELRAAVVVNHGTMIQPVWADAPAGANGNINNIINQSGLSAPYVSGVTDFDQFTATTTAEWGFSGYLNVEGGTQDHPAPINFDLGAEYLIDGIAIWNNTGTASLTGFNLFIAADNTFTSLEFHGAFSLTRGTSAFAEPAQVISLPATQARFVQIYTTENSGFSTARINEIAFSGSPIPEPSTPMLVLLGITWILDRKRRG